MQKIFKYKLALQDTQEISMPIGAKILCTQIQDGKICIWVVIQVAQLLNDREFRTIHIIGTGHKTNICLPYIGTVQLNDFVWHIFG